VIPLYPLVFHPRFKERIWGGRTIETLYGKPLPPGAPIGESWEISDRPGDESVVANGPLAGQTLRSLMETRETDILGAARPATEATPLRRSGRQHRRFPLLCKILDARDRPSLQVHPPDRAAHLGDPKTEMWYIAKADPGAELHVGLKRGVTREEFASKIAEGRVAECFHRIPVRTGDAMFLPSGRVHAIGAGLLIFEIQQNSDTTFRVHDWDRMGLDGKPRELHVPESLESIDFGDFEPALAGGQPWVSGPFTADALVRHPLFDVDVVRTASRDIMALPAAGPRVLAVAEGSLKVTGGGVLQALEPGQFCLLPASVADAQLAAEAGSAFLLAEAK
jgi:mannose-6-phosphate isomerase